MSRKSSNVTLKDIAAQAGVSHTAVSAALHGTGRISDEKREHILSVAKKMSYRPRLAAQMLRSNRTGHLGMIVCGVNLTDLMDSGFHGPIVSSFIQACEERDIRYHIEFAKEAVNPDDDFIPPAYFSGGMVDGALVVGYCDQPFAHWLEHENTRPWVSVGESAAYFVKDNSEQNVYQVAQHLVALGHRRIAFLHGDVSFDSNEEGLHGFERACLDFPMDTKSQWVHYIPMMPRRDGMHKTAEWARTCLAESDRPTAVICKGMGVARAVVSVAQQLQLDVPHQLSVIGFGTQAEAERSYPCMAHIQPDYPKIVHQALYILEQRLAGRDVANSSSLVAANMVWQDTVAPPQD
ncbi:MAG: hypothetical protein CMJ19_09350 [Phycisphaeraceae bacterium]|nr:hypothetical protein [Phycisphaeraceae bacterium]